MRDFILVFCEKLVFKTCELKTPWRDGSGGSYKIFFSSVPIRQDATAHNHVIKILAKKKPPFDGEYLLYNSG